MGMTDLEKIELSLRRATERLKTYATSKADVAIVFALDVLVEQIADDERERQRAAAQKVSERHGD